MGNIKMCMKERSEFGIKRIREDSESQMLLEDIDKMERIGEVRTHVSIDQAG